MNNFHLVAITNTSAEKPLYYVPLHQRLQEILEDDWQEQQQVFIDNVEEINFNAGYTPDESERFRLREFELPTWLRDVNSQNVVDIEPLEKNEEAISTIKGMIGFARNDQNEEIMLFQKFNRSRVIQPGRFLFLDNNTYNTAEHPGLTLDVKLSAMYFASQRKLLFHNFRTTNTFLPLMDYYEEASEQQIRDILGHQHLMPEDIDALSVDANQWFRKRFALLKNSKILDDYSPQEIAAQSKDFGLTVTIKKDKIVFPADKAEARRLLVFLNEEIYRGPITKQLFETNSKRLAA